MCLAFGFGLSLAFLIEFVVSFAEMEIGELEDAAVGVASIDEGMLQSQNFAQPFELQCLQPGDLTGLEGYRL